MAIGDPGHPGQTAPRAVEEDPSNGLDNVTILPQHMVEILAVGNLQSRQLATLIIVN